MIDNAMNNEHLTEEQMHPDFREAEESFREKAGPLWTEVREVQERIRSRVDLTEEERQDEFIQEYTGRILPQYEELANTLIGETMNKARRAYAKVYTEGVGEGFAAHLTSLANVGDEKLDELMSVAERTGQSDLSRAIAVTSLQRQGYSKTFEAWAARNPQTAEALKVLRNTPGIQQLQTRVGALKPPRVKQGELQPSPEMREKAAEEQRAERVRRRRFFQGRRDTSWSDKFGNRFTGRR